jgi:hypothetical protein
VVVSTHFPWSDVVDGQHGLVKAYCAVPILVFLNVCSRVFWYFASTSEFLGNATMHVNPLNKVVGLGDQFGTPDFFAFAKFLEDHWWIIGGQLVDNWWTIGWFALFNCQFFARKYYIRNKYSGRSGKLILTHIQPYC